MEGTPGLLSFHFLCRPAALTTPTVQGDLLLSESSALVAHCLSPRSGKKKINSLQLWNGGTASV